MPVPFPARLLIADDHAIVRRGLRSVLDAEPDLTVVAEAADGAEAVEIALTQEIDLAILDVAMPRLTGLQAAARIKAERPRIRLLILSMYDREQYLREAMAAGAAGYVLKQQADRDVVEACRAALRGDAFVYPGARRATEAATAPAQLSRRELEIVKLIAEGHSAPEIGELLVISPKTVERHRANILRKLGVRKTVDVARYAIREGLVEP